MGILKQALGAKMHTDTREYAPSFGMRSIFDHYKSDAFASAYPNIRAISAEYMQVKPYAIDANGKPIQNNNIINALYHPNQLDSSVSFFEKIAVSTLFHSKTYVLVWRREGLEAKPGGDFGYKGKNIAGFTFLEYPAVERRDGRTYYKIGTQEFNDKEVIVLPGGVDPTNLYGGYSPSEASRRWAKLDDYIADFQSGFFENGAVPAGVINVVAATTKEYDDIVDTILARHQGAGNNGKVTFSHTPLDQSGKPAQAQITWTPFGQSNKDMDFKSMYEQVDKRLSASYGVADIIKGIDSNAKYDNGGFSEKTFAKRAVYPLLLRNYTQFNHELNRITGGTGIAISFNYEIPALADEERVKAETKTLELNMINTALNAGFTLDSIVDAFELSNSYKLLKAGVAKEAKIENDKPDVDEGSEVQKSPNPSKIDGVTPVQEVTKSVTLKAKTNEDKLADAARDYMQSQVNRVVKEYKEEFSNAIKPDPIEDELELFVDEMLVTITGVLNTKGEEEYVTGVELAGLNIDDLQGYNVSEEATDRYRAYLKQVGTSYGDETAQSIRTVLQNSQDLGFTRAETEKALKGIMDTDEFRVKRLARTELNTAEQMGSLDGMKNLSSETGVSFSKVWHANRSDTCDFCQSLDGTVVGIDQPFIPLGGTIEASDGTILVNDWRDVEIAEAHPNCTCSIIWEVN